MSQYCPGYQPAWLLLLGREKAWMRGNKGMILISSPRLSPAGEEVCLVYTLIITIKICVKTYAVLPLIPYLLFIDENAHDSI
jgi:hypothetical protein